MCVSVLLHLPLLLHPSCSHASLSHSIHSSLATLSLFHYSISFFVASVDYTQSLARVCATIYYETFMAQSPMISVPLKRTDEVDWVTPLKRYIAASYQDDPEKYSEETGTIHRLRQDMRGAGNDVTGRDVLYRYFGQLEILDLRFPVDEAHIKIGFMW